MIKPKEVVITTAEGEEKTFIISKIPAVPAREIFTQYIPTALPKVGDYKVNEALMLRMMGYVAVSMEGQPLLLTTRALVDNHVPDWETLMRLEAEMAVYNCAFFQNGKGLDFLGAIEAKARQLISQTLTDLLAQSSPTVKQA